MDAIPENSPWCAYAPGKEEWKANGNYFTPEELRAMEAANDLELIPSLESVISAD